MNTENYTTLLSLKGRGVVVLGVGEGIGGAVCQAVRDAGGDVLCVDRDAAQAERTAARVGGVPMAADITDRGQVDAVMDKAEELFGDGFHGVVDVVGVTIPERLEDGTDESVERQFDLVLKHPVFVTQLAHPRLASRGGGSVVFIGSLGGVLNTPRLGLYGTAKAAVHHLATAAAFEYGPRGVRTNVIVTGRVLGSGIAPNPDPDALKVVEEAIPLRRAGRPDDIASVALFLLSDLSSYVNGARLAVDGGMGVVNPLPTTLKTD